MLRSVPVLSVELRAPRCGSHGPPPCLLRRWVLTDTDQIGYWLLRRCVRLNDPNVSVAYLLCQPEKVGVAYKIFDGACDVGLCIGHRSSDEGAIPLLMKLQARGSKVLRCCQKQRTDS